MVVMPRNRRGQADEKDVWTSVDMGKQQAQQSSAAGNRYPRYDQCSSGSQMGRGGSLETQEVNQAIQ